MYKSITTLLKQQPQSILRNYSTDKFPRGFKTGTAACGLKKTGNKDICIIHSSAPCNVAAVFTENKVKAAPVLLSKQLLETNNYKGFNSLVINSGGANACTGEQGLKNAKTMSNLTSSLLKAPQASLVMSTGIIGQQLDMSKVEKGIADAVTTLNESDWISAARAIMTTDKVPKLAQKSVSLNGGEVHIVGICKGAGMIHPNMATMLCTVCTDASISEDCLRALLKHSVHYSFNSINVDGDMSTNDTVAIFANGSAGNKHITDTTSSDFLQLQEAVREVTTRLAQMIVRDAEGASKFVTIKIHGADTEQNGHIVANSISTSSLVKSALYGEDANWGRVLAAVGYSGVDIDPLKVCMWFAKGDGKDVGLGKKNDPETSMQFLEKGTPLAKDENKAAQLLSNNDVAIVVELGMGKASSTMWTCDLTEEYVRANSHYRT
ncbi:amino-acid N-acetyltransferase [Heterostelium album PN500]|uniref:Arginine biosynthesis bifunctional protein ArgJ, mitochondrial n=1 Tax=Heterostelium pallidum (strain ATCC 26659 / Pp 5 / PN500) TaxID=670386 RepID=ARGJ_HETP5|nr:amino-acid N-acetyltransferase [Heterostelium album PN500]D3AXF4.1 RecName: Full=Arginine biosynthesis bifunctional protein ArgJ, mitochondrial; Includes: RecName: Full=Glutamate N-acetyltransferase; Short=GAT; AltName: Full=Ornithine acetyltransferase; Short=OATase; AltName: Full=Ornithine transacetylase; Includes: RecName: Full=Amino-acid acetyltransferase; AltName: Full=N-acetylglutamate synthase; Short=AGS; Contains: RecName: Full=Arginine biosynthesis bifunctional protein ArgJ alpha chain;|eukprot:XP_020438328.1 amino-acid N-acetyltransferase [Heterostelium album PN500]